MVRTVLADGNSRDPQIAYLIDRAGAPVTAPDGSLVEVKLYVRWGRTPNLTLYHGDIRYHRQQPDGPGRWIYTELPLRSDGWVLAEDETSEPPPTQIWGPVN